MHEHDAGDVPAEDVGAEAFGIADMVDVEHEEARGDGVLVPALVGAERGVEAEGRQAALGLEAAPAHFAAQACDAFAPDELVEFFLGAAESLSAHTAHIAKHDIASVVSLMNKSISFFSLLLTLIFRM